MKGIKISLPENKNSEIFKIYTLDVHDYTRCEDLLKELAYWASSKTEFFVLYNDYTEEEILGSGSKDIYISILECVRQSKLLRESVSLYAVMSNENTTAKVRIISCIQEKGLVLHDRYTMRTDRLLDMIFLDRYNSNIYNSCLIYHNDIPTINEIIKKARDTEKSSIPDLEFYEFTHARHSIGYKSIDELMTHILSLSNDRHTLYPIHIYMSVQGTFDEYLYSIHKGIIYIDKNKTK